MQVISILDVLLVDGIRLHALRPEGVREELDEVVLELRRVVRNVLSCVFANDEHLTQMRFGLSMTLETVLISALLLANLAVPAQTLKAFRLHLVCEILGRSNCALHKCQCVTLLARPTMLTFCTRHDGLCSG